MNDNEPDFVMRAKRNFNNPCGNMTYAVDVPAEISARAGKGIKLMPAESR